MKKPLLNLRKTKVHGGTFNKCSWSLSNRSFVVLILWYFLITACNRPLTKIEEYQEPKGFWYQDEHFDLKKITTPLRTDGLYFRIIDTDSFGDNFQMFRFYPDGLVIEYSVYNTPDKVVGLEKVRERNIHGYFQIESDSIFFTTKVYYDHHPTFYKGEIFQDSLVLHFQNYHKKREGQDVFYFLEKK